MPRLPQECEAMRGGRAVRFLAALFPGIGFLPALPYRARFIVVGGLERASCPPEGLAKFHAVAKGGKLIEVFQSGENVIYQETGRNQTSGPYW